MAIRFAVKLALYKALKSLASSAQPRADSLRNGSWLRKAFLGQAVCCSLAISAFFWFSWRAWIGTAVWYHLIFYGGCFVLLVDVCCLVWREWYHTTKERKANLAIAAVWAIAFLNCKRIQLKS